MSDHDRLINALACDAAPVRRPAPPLARAVIWTLVCLLAGFLATRPGQSGITGTLL